MMTRMRLTYEDYAALPDDGRRYELHEGELSVTPAPGVKHQETLAKLFVILWGHVNARGLGKVLFAPVDCILENMTVVQPDIVFVETSRLRERAGHRGAADARGRGHLGVERQHRPAREAPSLCAVRRALLLDRRSSRENDRGV